MKTRLLVMVGMMISTTIFAQKNRDSRKPETSGYERMKRELALSDSQYESVKSIDSKYSKKRDEQRVKSKRRRFEDREAMRVLHRERENDMRKIFTPAQNKKWNELQASRKGRNEYGNKRHRKHGHHHKQFRKHGNDRGGRDAGKRG